jgi:hypothetical protein
MSGALLTGGELTEMTDGGAEVPGDQLDVAERRTRAAPMDAVGDRLRMDPRSVRGRPRLVEQTAVCLDERRHPLDHRRKLRLARLRHDLPRVSRMLQRQAQVARRALGLGQLQRTPLPAVFITALRRTGVELLEDRPGAVEFTDLVQAHCEEVRRTLGEQQRIGELRLDLDATLQQPGRHLHRPGLHEAQSCERDRDGARLAGTLGAHETRPRLDEGGRDVLEDPPVDRLEAMDVRAPRIVVVRVAQRQRAQPRSLGHALATDGRA